MKSQIHQYIHDFGEFKDNLTGICEGMCQSVFSVGVRDWGGISGVEFFPGPRDWGGIFQKFPPRFSEITDFDAFEQLYDLSAPQAKIFRFLHTVYAWKM